MHEGGSNVEEIGFSGRSSLNHHATGAAADQVAASKAISLLKKPGAWEGWSL